MASILNAVGLAATRLACVMKTQHMIGGDGSEVMAAISEALDQVVKELGLVKVPAKS